MLTVWTICWGGKYSDYYVKRLQTEVALNLSHPHRFRCITDRDIEGVDCVPFSESYPGWWSKVELFKRQDGPNIWLDLDVVITGSLDWLVDKYGREPMAAPSNWAQSGHGGVQSSVMVWNPCGMTRKIFDLYDPEDPRLNNWPPTTGMTEAGPAVWGDQEWYTLLRDRGDIRVTPIVEGVKSYKYHCRSGLPSDTRIVVFHGDPKPDRVKADWFTW